MTTTWRQCFWNPFSFSPYVSAISWMLNISFHEPRWLAPLTGAIGKPKSSQSSCCVPRPFFYFYFCEIGGRAFGKHLTQSPSSSGSALLTEQAKRIFWVASRNSMVDLVASGLALCCTQEFLVKAGCYYFFPLKLELKSEHDSERLSSR